ncbi:unknown [Clostridium sp. CAG:91]|nr:unknown [Clostridium sp. CAG:91]
MMNGIREILGLQCKTAAIAVGHPIFSGLYINKIACIKLHSWQGGVCLRAVVLSRRCLNNVSEYITLCPTCQHYFAYFSNNFAKAVKKPIIMGFFVILDLIVFSLFLIIYSIYAYKS